ncbi:hypothetical protein V3C99_013547 [Haemonchus contortus]
MDRWPFPRDPTWDDMMRDFNRFKGGIKPYWREADHSVMHVGEEVHPVINDDKKFAITLDVSHFRPEELNVHLDGRELIVEGKHSRRDGASSMEKSFVRKWTIPSDVSLDAIHSRLSAKGHLSVEAPKEVAQIPQKRIIPIVPTETFNY